MSSSVLVVGRIWMGWLGGYLGGHQKDDLKTRRLADLISNCEDKIFHSVLGPLDRSSPRNPPDLSINLTEKQAF